MTQQRGKSELQSKGICRRKTITIVDQGLTHNGPKFSPLPICVESMKKNGFYIFK